MIAEPAPPDRFVKLDEVKRRVGLGKTMIYRLVQEGKFLTRYKLSPLASRRKDREIGLHRGCEGLVRGED